MDNVNTKDRGRGIDKRFGGPRTFQKIGRPKTAIVLGARD